MQRIHHTWLTFHTNSIFPYRNYWTGRKQKHQILGDSDFDYYDNKCISKFNQLMTQREEKPSTFTKVWCLPERITSPHLKINTLSGLNKCVHFLNIYLIEPILKTFQLLPDWKFRNLIFLSPVTSDCIVPFGN